jgi:hypothetical protein
MGNKNRAVRLLLLGIIFLFGVFLGVLVGKGRLTGNAIDIGENYSYTTAICNVDKQCIDIEVFCSNGQLEKLEPISELVQFDEHWVDPRENKTSFCSQNG